MRRFERSVLILIVVCGCWFCSEAVSVERYFCRVLTDKNHVIFSPGEDLKSCLVIDNNNLKNKISITLNAVIDQDGKRIRFNEQINIDENKKRIAIPLNAPNRGGVYVLNCTVSGLPGKDRVAAMEFVVVEPKKANPTAAELKKILIKEINCAEDPDPKRFIEHGDSEIRQTPLGVFRYSGNKSSNCFPPLPRKAIQKVNVNNISWFAYRIENVQPGMPYLLEVTYPDDEWRAMGISIITPHYDNTVNGIQLDSGVVCGGNYPNSNRVKTHGLYFWPRSENIVVMICNRFPGHTAAIGKISLYRLPDGLPPCQIAVPEENKRHLGFYFEESRISENFGGAKEPRRRGKNNDPERGWNFFYRSALNLIDYMKFTGMDTVHYLASGYNDTLYPSELLPHCGRYDSEHLLRDPYRKDLLKLYFSLFDREGMQFVPELMIDCGGMKNVNKPDGDKDPSPLLCVNREGKTEQNVFEPLNPQCQEYILSVIREMMLRYRDHPSFTGVQLRLWRYHNYFYKGMTWGYGDEVMTLFERETGIRIPVETDDPQRFEKRYQYLTGEKYKEFTDWRCRKVRDFIARIAHELTACRKDLKLFLSFFNSAVMPDLRYPAANLPVVQAADFSMERWLREEGISWPLYNEIPNAVLMNNTRDGGHFVNQCYTLRGNRPGHYWKEWNFSKEVSDIVKSSKLTTGCISFYSYFESRLDDFMLKSENKWFREAQTWMVGVFSPSEPYELESYAHAMNCYNPAYLLWGAIVCPFGREDNLREFAQKYRSLPAINFTREESSQQPLGVYSAFDGKRSWMYIVNESFAPAKAMLRLLPQDTGRLIRDDGIDTDFETGMPLDMELEIEPYSLRVIRSDKGIFKLERFSAQAGNFYTNWLQKRYNAVSKILLASSAEENRQMARSMATLLQEKCWIDLWKMLESANVFDAVISCGIDKKDFYQLTE